MNVTLKSDVFQWLWRATRFMIVASVALLAMFGGANAAELVMFEQAGCPWCRAFDREIAPGYANTDQGKIAPLRRVDFRGPRPTDLADLGNIQGTPVFVLMDRGREVGRITGYPGDDFFWPMLDELIELLPPKPAT